MISAIWRCGPCQAWIWQPFDWAGRPFVPLKGRVMVMISSETAFENGAVATFQRKWLKATLIFWWKMFWAHFKHWLQPIFKRQSGCFAVTGSNGKTTTKDMLAQLCPPPTLTYKTRETIIMKLVFPYTVLHMPEGDRQTRPEMGQDHLGDIHLLSRTGASQGCYCHLNWGSAFGIFKDRSEIAKENSNCGWHARRWPSGGSSWSDRECLPPWKTKVVRFGPDEEIFITELVGAKG